MRAPLAILILLPLPVLAQVEQGPPETPFEPAWEGQTRAPALPDTPVRAAPFAGPLEHPWGIAVLPDGSFLVTERPGRMRLMGADGTLSEPIAGLPPVLSRDQGGLLDVAVAPDFATSRLVFWTYAKPLADGLSATTVARGRLSPDGTAMTEVRDLWTQEPASHVALHYGARVLPDGEGHLWVTTGERFTDAERVLAQDLATGHGKVLRLTEEGEPAAGNPFAEAPFVWTYGHRNVQGAAIDAAGRLWTGEHGPLAGDELNLSRPGTNYGWPEVSYGLNYDGSFVGTGEPRGEGFAEPIYFWDPAIAPSGMIFYRGDAFADWTGDLLIASLNPGGLVRLRIEGERVAGEERLLPDIGRVRDVEERLDGTLLLLIDAPDGGVLQVAPG
jgi:glucose/arabinose dehydrogenase